MLLSISSARHTTCCSCFQAAYLWSASHQVRRARVLGQSWRLFLGKDWDLSASVLTLQKNLKNKTCIALILEMLLFWLISAKWVYRGRIIGSEAGGQAGRDAHIHSFFQMLKIMTRYLKNSTVNGVGDDWCAAVVMSYLSIYQGYEQAGHGEWLFPTPWHSQPCL